MTVLSRTAGRVAVAAGTALLGALTTQSPAAAAAEHDPAPPALAPSVALQPVTAESTATGLGNAVVHTLRPVKNTRLDPFANSKADPLDNEVALVPTSPGSAPISSRPLTAPLSSGGGPGRLPVVGPALGLLPG
jgi:hypothetical protein